MSDKYFAELQAQANQQMPSQSFTEALKPVSGLKTTVSQVAGVLGMVSGAIMTGLGVYALVAGRNFSRSNYSEAGINSLLQANAVIGVVGGLVSMGFGYANFESGSGAARARRFAELHDSLNAKTVGTMSL